MKGTNLTESEDFSTMDKNYAQVYVESFVTAIEDVADILSGMLKAITKVFRNVK